MSSITMNLYYTGQNGNAQSAIRRRMKLSLRQMRHLSGSEAQAVRMIRHCEQGQKDLNRAQMKTIWSIAEAHGVSSAQVILRWDLQRGIVVIPGSSNPEHIKENLDLFGFELTDEEMAAISFLDRGEKHDWY